MTIAKRIVAVLLAVMMIFSVMAIGAVSASAANITCDTLYLQPSLWTAENARFAACFYGENGDAWVNAVKRTDDASTYTITVPEGNWTNVIFCRMDGATTENNWDNKWNQTGDLTWDGTSNCFTVTDWSEGFWTTYTEKIVYFVNTNNWNTVNGFGWTDGIGGDTAWPGKAATLVDAEKGVYAYNPGNRKQVLFNNGDAYTSYFACTDVYGKYIEPITNKCYNTAEEAWVASGVSGDTGSDSYITIDTLYLKPSLWTAENARFAACFYGNNGDAWVNAVKKADDASTYTIKVPEGNWTNVIFCRMNPATTENNWDNKWNQTDDLTWDGVSNCFTVTDWSTGNWSTYTEKVVYFVNTNNWKNVYGFGWTTGIGSNTAWPGKDATLVDANNSVYSFNPGDRKEVLFNDGEVNTSYFTCTDVYGKYIEPITNTYYNTVQEAWAAANASKPTQPTTEATQPTTKATEPTTESTPSDENGEFAGKKYYLVPNEWAKDGARFAAYFFTYGYTGVWVDMVDSDRDGIYEVTVPNGNYRQVVFYRMDGSKAENVESNAWNKSNQTFLEYGNCYTITLPWSEYDPGDWSNYTPVEKIVYFVNTDNWAEVYGFGWTNGIGSNTAWPGKAATLVDAKNGVYSYDPGNRKQVLFNNNEVNTSYFTCSEVYGKYIEPKTNTYYNTAAEAWAAAGAVEPAEKNAYYLSGSFNSWSETSNPLYVTDGVATTSMTLDAGQYEFKILDNGVWYGYDTAISNKTSTSGITVRADAGNAVLSASGGTYTFSYTISTRKLVITHSAGSQGGYTPGEGTEPTNPSDSEIIATEPTEGNKKCETGHSFGKATVTKKATYFAKGKKVQTCSVCGATKTVKTAKLKLAKPTVNVKAGAKAFTVNFTKKVKGATKFEVKYTVKGKTAKKIFKAPKSDSKTISKLSKGNYKVRVRAIATKGKKTAYSKWTKAKTVNVK